MGLGQGQRWGGVSNGGNAGYGRRALYSCVEGLRGLKFVLEILGNIFS